MKIFIKEVFLKRLLAIIFHKKIVRKYQMKNPIAVLNINPMFIPIFMTAHVKFYRS